LSNKFVILVPYYNCKDFILECVKSILSQKYTNYRVIFCDDLSDDGTSDLIPSNDKFKVRVSSSRLTALENLHNCLVEEDISDDDIVVILDGDDFLIDPNALSILDSLYNVYKPLLTYGQYIYPNGQIGHCRSYTRDEFANLRQLDWRASHLRTFKKVLYTELLKQDPEALCHKDKDGHFYKMTYDISMFHPMMEIAGYDKIFFNQIPLYYYRIHQNNDHNINSELQRSIEVEIRTKKKFNQIF